MDSTRTTGRSGTRSVRELLDERSFTALLENVEEVFSLIDENGEVLFRSPGWTRVLGYDAEALAEMEPFSIVHPEDQDELRASHRRALENPGERVGPTALRVQDAEGAWREGDLSVVNLLEDPDFQTVIYNWRDATGRAAAERELAERARQQEAVAEFGRLALEGVPLSNLMDAAVTTVRAVLGIEYAKVLGLLPGEEEFLLRAGSGWRDGLVGDARVGTEADSQAGFTLGARAPVVVEDLEKETRFSGPRLLVEHDVVSGVSVVIEGEERPFGVLGAHTTRRRDFSSHDVYFVRAMADVLAQAIVRERRMREARFHSLLLDSVGQAVIACDPEGRITYWNRQAETMFQRSRSSVLGASVFVLVPPRDREERASAILDRLRSGERWEGELDLQREDGTEFPALVTGVPIQGDEGDLIGIVGVVTDITEMKELERRYLRSQRMEALGKLAGGIAHDFNNLLTAILGYTDLTREIAGDDHRIADTMGEVEDAARRAMDLTSQLLAYSRRQILQPRLVDLNEEVAEMETLVRRLIGEDVDLQVTLHPNAGTVRVDPGQLEQVILNLVVNARDAMPGGGRLRIETGFERLEEPYVHREIEVEPGEWAILTVIDTGEGMDVETREHLFEPFYTTKEGSQGTGLGLATVYGIVAQSGGHVWVYSEPGEGATFRIFLPRHAEDSAELPPADEREVVGGGETILVAEDEEAVRSLVCRVLRSLGYRVLEASDGKEALEVAAAHEGSVDLLFSDIVMPGMPG
ncbi:MAG: PAS domain S-box protein, partial [Gemmatimonadota bacterium]|nr:PAS domain S-box protein [Gemmatimonadota bacterium]